MAGEEWPNCWEAVPAGGADLAAEMLGHTSSKITKEHYVEPDEAANPVTAEILQLLAPSRREDER